MKCKNFSRIAMAAAALCAAFSFSGCQKVEETVVTETSMTSITPMTTVTTTVAATEEAVPVMASETVTETTETTSETSERIGVPKMQWDNHAWDKEFMEDTIFVGDSVCRALYVYNSLLTTKQVAAVGGGAARNIYDYTFKMEDNEFTLQQAVEHYQPAVVFLWMGINDINMTDKPTYAENLKKIAEDVISRSPESRVVVLSMSPTADYHEWNANERIREYNQAAKEMCEGVTDKEIYYFDIQDILSDEEGYLLPECDGGDGMHLSEMAYIRMLSYISDGRDSFMLGKDAAASENEETAIDTTVTADTQAAETYEIFETDELEAAE